MNVLEDTRVQDAVISASRTLSYRGYCQRPFVLDVLLLK